MQEWSHPFLQEPGPLRRIELILAMRHLEADLFPSGRGEAEDFDLLRLLPFNLLVPPLGSLEGRQLPLSVGHIGPCGAQLLEGRLDLFGIPCELLEVADTMESSLPLGSIFGQVLLAESDSHLHASPAKIRLAGLLLRGVALICQAPYDELPGNFLLELCG